MSAIFSLLSSVYHAGYDVYKRCKRERPEAQPQPAQMRSATTGARRVDPSEPDFREPNLVKAVWARNEVWTRQLLHVCENPNNNNLLPRLIMCRIPRGLHVDFEGELSDEQADGIEKFATILVQNRARLDPIHVEEFVAFQSELEKKITEAFDTIRNGSRAELFASVKDISNTDIDLHNLIGFKAMKQQFAGSTNPFIKIIIDEINPRNLISSNEREVCRFAAKLLPELVKISKK
ncbi:MAG TPA: hypothetical protein VLG76_08605 [Rhabdochlamydiaceae bacterium]|nr:hypothetical protein [Rhabdochlamydiaceae bacterium]